MTKLLGIDIGTTHCKAGLFDSAGSDINIATKETITHFDEKGHAYYDPEEIWSLVVEAIKEVNENRHGETTVIGIASMAETGILLDRVSGRAKTDMIPWFDKRTLKQAHFIAKESDAFRAFQKTGLHNSYKYGLAKLLWLEEQQPGVTKNATWLSAADYIAYRLTGEMGTDYSLAARTFAFRVDTKEWDESWLRHFGFKTEMFPTARPSGQMTGRIPSTEFAKIGLLKGTPVAVSGHDHVCAALAVGAVEPGVAFDSIGTAETLVGTLEKWDLGTKEFQSGLSFGCHTVAGRYFWMGSLPSSGGSIEWMRRQFSDEMLSYETINGLLDTVEEGPTGILYYPFLSGSGSTRHNPDDRASFIGIKKEHHKGDLLKAVLEGNAFEMDAVKKRVEQTVGIELNDFIAVGGGTRNKTWMQIKADVSNVSLLIPSFSEATLLGAALTAAVGCGLYENLNEATGLLAKHERIVVEPDKGRHQTYQEVYETGYNALLAPLRGYFNHISKERNE